MAEQEAAKKTAEAKTPPADIPPEWAHVGVVGRIKNWIPEEGPWWLCSFVFHLVLVCSLALISGKVVEKIVDEAPSFEEAKIDKPADVPKEIERFEVGETPEDPTELNTETLTLEKPAQMAQEEKYYDDSATFHRGRAAAWRRPRNQPNLGGLGGFDIKGLGAGPAVKGKGGVGVGVGTGTHPGSGGDGWGFGGRGTGSRKAMLGSGGGTRQSERAVAAALNWLARHQSPDGSWSLTAYKARCKDASCTGEAEVGDRPAAATALGLLPFLGRRTDARVEGALQADHLRRHRLPRQATRRPDGDLRMGGARCTTTAWPPSPCANATA